VYPAVRNDNHELVRRLTWKSALLSGGVTIALIGFMFLPLGCGAVPKRIPPNAFKDVVETGTFVKEGLALIAVGLITAVLSRFLPGDDDD